MNTIFVEIRGKLLLFILPFWCVYNTIKCQFSSIVFGMFLTLLWYQAFLVTNVGDLTADCRLPRLLDELVV